MTTLAIIPARAGSKGVPRKNVRPFMGKPLVAWAIEVAKQACDSVLVSSDDPEVLDIAKAYGVVPLERPAEFSRDDTPMLDVLTHAISSSEGMGDPVVLLQPTQPLRRLDQVKEALKILEADKCADSVVSVVEIPAHMSPDYAMYADTDRLYMWNHRVPTRRQDCRKAYYRDGTVYAIRRRVLVRGMMYGQAVPFVIPAEDSCTIDTEADWARAEEVMRKSHGRLS